MYIIIAHVVGKHGITMLQLLHPWWHKQLSSVSSQETEGVPILLFLNLDPSNIWLFCQIFLVLFPYKEWQAIQKGIILGYQDMHYWYPCLEFSWWHQLVSGDWSERVLYTRLPSVFIQPTVLFLRNQWTSYACYICKLIWKNNAVMTIAYAIGSCIPIAHGFLHGKGTKIKRWVLTKTFVWSMGTSSEKSR